MTYTKTMTLFEHLSRTKYAIRDKQLQHIDLEARGSVSIDLARVIAWETRLIDHTVTRCMKEPVVKGCYKKRFKRFL